MEMAVNSELGPYDGFELCMHITKVPQNVSDNRNLVLPFATAQKSSSRHCSIPSTTAI